MNSDPGSPRDMGGGILEQNPYRVCIGHTADVVDLSWSKPTGLLLSAGVDGAVRLWAPAKSEACQHVFGVSHTWILTIQHLAD